MDADKSGTVDIDELRTSLSRLPPSTGQHDADQVIEWVCQFGTQTSYFVFDQWQKAFVPYQELTPFQMDEILKRRKYELLLNLEHCHDLAREMFSGRMRAAKHYGLHTIQLCLGMAKWLFEAKSFQLPKPPRLGEAWAFPATNHYREHIDAICTKVQHTHNYG